MEATVAVAQTAIDKRISKWVNEDGVTGLVMNFNGRGLWASDGCAMLRINPAHVPEGAMPEIGQVTARRTDYRTSERFWIATEKAADHYAPMLPYAAQLPNMQELELTDWRLDLGNGEQVAMLHCKNFQAWINARYFKLITNTLDADNRKHNLYFAGTGPNNPVYITYKHLPVATVMPFDLSKRQVWPMKQGQQSS